MSHRISLSTLRTNVRHHLDEATAAFWTNAQLLVYINQAIDRVWNEVRNSRGDYFFKSLASTAGSQTLLSETYAASSLQIAVGAIEITLPPDFAELKLIRVTTADYEHVRFTQSELSDPDFRALLEYPDNVGPTAFRYAIVGERTMLYGPRSDTLLNTTFYYIFRPSPLSDDADTQEMPYPLDRAVEAFASATALAMDRAPEAAMWEARGQRLMADFLGANKRQSMDPVIVVDALAGWG